MTPIGRPRRALILTDVGEKLRAIVAKIHRHDLKPSRDSRLKCYGDTVRRPVRLCPIGLLIQVAAELGDPLRIRPVGVDNIHLIVPNPVGREGDSATVWAGRGTGADPSALLD